LGAIHRAAAVVTVAGFGLAGMNSHPDPQRLREVPVVGEERPLCDNRSRDRVVGGDEHGVEPVARGLDDAAIV
jgi:hypothetical protein